MIFSLKRTIKLRFVIYQSKALEKLVRMALKTFIVLLSDLYLVVDLCVVLSSAAAITAVAE